MSEEKSNSKQPVETASPLNRRRFLAGAASISVTTLVAGCRDPNEVELDKTTTTSTDPEESDPNRKELLLAPMLPTVAIKTDSGRWLPRTVITGAEPGWELALEAGELYDPAVDLGGSGEGYSPPDWLPDEYRDDLKGNRFFRLPSQLLVSGSPTLEDSDYPTGLSLDCTCPNIQFRNTNFDPTNQDTLGFDAVVRVGSGGERLADEISEPTFSARVGEDNPFRKYVGRHPDANPQTGEIRTQSDTNYGAVDTSSERLGSALEFGLRELLKLYVTTAMTFTTGSSIIAKGLFPTLLRELGSRVRNLALGGSPEELLAIAVFNAIATGDGWKRPENVDSETPSEAGAINGTLFMPPMNDSMRNLYESPLGGRTPEYDVTIVDHGVGLSGPMLYLVDPPKGSEGSQKTVYDVKLDPRSTFLRAFNDNPEGPAIVPLEGVGVSPGDRLTIEVLGDYERGGIENDTQNDTIAVFSASDQLLGECQLVDGEYECSEPESPRRRVPDAIDAGPDVRTDPTYYQEKPTDIPEDFAIDGSVTVTVPQGATHLFLAANDDFYRDNRDDDGDYTVRIRPPDG